MKDTYPTAGEAARVAHHRKSFEPSALFVYEDVSGWHITKQAKWNGVPNRQVCWEGIATPAGQGAI